MSVFGPGYGECICIHSGNGEWLVVDSCLTPTGGAAPLAYLHELGIDPATAVKLVLVTHWDDDHIGGVASVVRAAPEATVGCSAALRNKDILAYVFAQERAQGKLGSGVDELRQILELRGNDIVYAKENLPLHPRPPGQGPVAIALSPSEEAVSRSVQSLIEAATDQDVTVPRRYRAPEGPNGASVACEVRACSETLILGGDLEHSTNTQAGWDAVLENAKPPSLGSLHKVPHHGSEGAHHERVWDEMLRSEALSIVTPWTLGANFLPLDRDLNRLKGLTSRLYLTAAPALRRAKKDPQVERLLRRLHGENLEELVGWGQVRARLRPGEDWTVELAGDACAVI